MLAEMFTMRPRPRSRIPGTKARLTRNVPSRPTAARDLRLLGSGVALFGGVYAEGEPLDPCVVVVPDPPAAVGEADRRSALS